MIQEPGANEIVVVILANIMIKKGDQVVEGTTIVQGPGKEAAIIPDTMGDTAQICVERRYCNITNNSRADCHCNISICCLLRRYVKLLKAYYRPIITASS